MLLEIKRQSLEHGPVQLLLEQKLLIVLAFRGRLECLLRDLVWVTGGRLVHEVNRLCLTCVCMNFGGGGLLHHNHSFVSLLHGLTLSSFSGSLSRRVGYLDLGVELVDPVAYKARGRFIWRQLLKSEVE